MRRKSILIFTFFLSFTMLANNFVSAEEVNGVGKVTTGFFAKIIDFDNDDDQIKDFNDACPNSPVTQTYIDTDQDGCNDNTASAVTTVNSSVDTNSSKSKPVDTDNDGVTDENDGCPFYDPKTDANLNGCEDNNLRTILTGVSSDESMIYITGISFVDGVAFDSADDYSINISLYSPDAGNAGNKEGYVATTYSDPAANELIGADSNIEYSNFSVAIPIADLTNAKAKTTYQINIKMTSNDGSWTQSETLYAPTSITKNINSKYQIKSENNRLYLVVKN